MKTMGTMTRKMARLTIQFDDHDDVNVPHPAFFGLGRATATARKRANFAYDGWTHFVIRLGRQSVMVTR